MEPPAEVTQSFKKRGDNQIMGLELLSISLGMVTFEKRLANRKIVIHSDNKGSEVRVAVFGLMTMNTYFCL